MDVRTDYEEAKKHDNVLLLLKGLAISNPEGLEWLVGFWKRDRPSGWWVASYTGGEAVDEEQVVAWAELPPAKHP